MKRKNLSPEWVLGNRELLHGHIYFYLYLTQWETLRYKVTNICFNLFPTYFQKTNDFEVA